MNHSDKSVEYYETEHEWINDPDPYGDIGECEKCHSFVDVEHCDVFHQYKCSHCGYFGEENCFTHSIEMAKCQLKESK